jgi:hypothetical protein
VVPHITATAKTSEAIRTIEISSLKHGIYNLGFLLVRNDINGKDFARWWAERLHDYCIVDHAQGLFTDQRWIDLAVGTFDFFSVLRHHGLDVASWNMPYRNITRRGEGYSADGDDLIFYHFSGIGRGNAHRWVREMFAPAGPIVADLEFRYEQTINDCGQNELEKIQPAYDRFDTGETIDAFDRKFYRDNEEFRRAHPNPYSEISARALKQSHVAAANVIRGSAGPRPSAVTHEHTAQLLFDRDFYSKVYGLSCFWDPWSAYLALGARADHKPNAFFEPTFYRAMVGSRSLRRYRTPLHHYVKEGLLSGVPPIWNFDESYYLEANEDVRDAVAQGALVCGFHHYMIAGAAEGRSPSGFFDETAYLRQNPDVANAVRAGVFRSGGEHFIRHGRAEGRARTVIAPA